MLVGPKRFPPAKGAAASRLGSLAKYWSGKTQVTVITPDSADSPNEYFRITVPLTRWRLDFVRLFYLFPRLLRIVKDLHVDVVFVSFPVSWQLLEGYSLVRRLGCPLVVDIRDLPEAMYPLEGISLIRRVFNAWMQAIAYYVFRKASRIATVTDWFRKELIRFLDYPPSRIFVIRNGSEAELFKKALGVKKEFDIVYSGSLSNPVRNPPMILRYLCCLVDLYPSVRVLFLSDFDTKMGKEFLVRIKSFGLDENIVVENMVPNFQLPELLGRARSGLNSLMSGWDAHKGAVGAKVYEYLAAGLPVIGLLDPDFYIEARRLIADNKAGILHPDPERLAEETVALLKSPSRLRKMSIKAREVGERFDRRRLAEDYFYSVILPAWKEHNPNRDE